MILHSKEQGVSSEPCASRCSSSWQHATELGRHLGFLQLQRSQVISWPLCSALAWSFAPVESRSATAERVFSKVCECSCVWHSLTLPRGKLPTIWHFTIQPLMFAKITKISIINLKTLLASSCWPDDNSKFFSVPFFITLPCENNHCIWTVNTSVQPNWVCHFHSTSQWQQCYLICPLYFD